MCRSVNGLRDGEPICCQYQCGRYSRLHWPPALRNASMNAVASPMPGWEVPAGSKSHMTGRPAWWARHQAAWPAPLP